MGRAARLFNPIVTIAMRALGRREHREERKRQSRGLTRVRHRRRKRASQKHHPKQWETDGSVCCRCGGHNEAVQRSNQMQARCANSLLHSGNTSKPDFKSPAPITENLVQSFARWLLGTKPRFLFLPLYFFTLLRSSGITAANSSAIHC